MPFFGVNFFFNKIRFYGVVKYLGIHEVYSSISAISDKLSMRFEGEYLFPQEEDYGEVARCKVAQGWKVRLMCILR